MFQKSLFNVFCLVLKVFLTNNKQHWVRDILINKKKRNAFVSIPFDEKKKYYPHICDFQCYKYPIKIKINSPVKN